MSYAPRLVIEAPARKPLPNGIFDAVEWLPTENGHWLNGVTWEALDARSASGIGFDVEGVPSEGTGLPLQFPFQPEQGYAQAFSIVATYKFSTIGHNLAYAQTRATELLLAREQARVEQAMWTGDLFLDNDADVPENSFDANATSLGTGLSPVDALAAVEEWQGNVYGSQGVIHMTREMAIHCANGYLLTLGDDKVLRTALGTRVVAGAGYSPEAGNDIIVTPALFGIRGDVFDAGERIIDKDKNDVYGLVQRPYVIGYDPVGCAKASITLT